MLKTKKRNVFSVIIIIFIVLSCSGVEKQQDKPLNKVSINMVTHGQSTDPFWSVVSNGAKDAAKELGIDFYYQSPQNFDMITMSQIIDAVVSTNPDGIIVSVPDVAALKNSILAASKKDIPIIVINAGSEIMEEVDILTYVGQSEYEAGMKAAKELIKYNVTNALCVNHEIGNISLDKREQGFR